jgi:glycosyltransferase involved in cell wall biosynthesis
MTRLISIIVPVFNEEDNIAPLLQRLNAVTAAICTRHPDMSFEVVITDNHSTDGTFARLSEATAADAIHAFRLRVFRFAKNIGFQKSILVGYTKAEGDAVIQIDADLQDPPELIETFIEKWQEGHEVVYGVRRSRQEGRVITALRRMFYRLIDRISDDPLPHDAGDFRLVDRSLVDVVVALRDHDPYLRGLFASLGMRQTGVPYDRAPRERGESKFHLTELIRLSWDGLTNHSVVPLKLSSYLALAITLIGAGLAVFYLASWLFLSRDLPLGFLTLVLLQLASVAVLAFLIGIQGEYISRIYAQVKEKPLAIVQNRLVAGRHASASETEPMTEPIEVIWTGQTGTPRSPRQTQSNPPDTGTPGGTP